MVVVAIIGVLVLLGLRAYTSQKERAMNSIAKANASTIQTILVGAMADTNISNSGDVHTAILGTGYTLGTDDLKVDEMVNPYSSGIAVYQVDTDESDFTTASSSAERGMVSIWISAANMLYITARGADGEILLTTPLPATKY